MKKWLLLFLIVGLLILGSRSIEGFDCGATGDQRCEYLEDMVKYLKIVVQMQNERQRMYPLASGFGSPPQTFSSPRLTALEK
jgi:hypothetical protein